MPEPLILIADDAAFMRKMVKMTLSEAGITQVLEAKNGDEAIQLYQEHHPDLVLLDITMAGKTGLEALKEIMERKRRNDFVRKLEFDQLRNFRVLDEGPANGIIFIGKGGVEFTAGSFGIKGNE